MRNGEMEQHQTDRRVYDQLDCAITQKRELLDFQTALRDDRRKSRNMTDEGQRRKLQRGPIPHFLPQSPRMKRLLNTGVETDWRPVALRETAIEQATVRMIPAGECRVEPEIPSAIENVPRRTPRESIRPRRRPQNQRVRAVMDIVEHLLAENQARNRFLRDHVRSVRRRCIEALTLETVQAGKL